ncbi:MAG: hypothetical protein C0595_09765 [Marinilabiliales bacterium]|nr:MAG: hypothetical protein C0595_09765 [Marinilabiliales bacterium]
MKKLIILVVIATLGVGLNAQNVFNKGSIMFNAGIGGPSSYGFIPTVNFSGEVGVIPTGTIGIVSFGGLAEFQLGQYTYGYLVNNENFARFYLGPRAAWHFLGLKTNDIDVYAGVGFGIVINGKSDTFSGNTKVHPDVFAGGRWMFGENMGLFAELGYTGLSFAKFGITFGL